MPGVAQVALLIPTHALPPLSYRIPEDLAADVRVGSVVVVPLSGYSRLGVIVDFEDDGERELEEVRAARDDLALPEELVELCLWIRDATALSLAAVLRAALPPGLNTSRYRITDPAPGWSWREGSLVARITLRRALGGDGLKAAESQGRLEFAPLESEPTKTEWAMIQPGACPDLKRAPRQRALFEALRRHPDGCPSAALLSGTGGSRATLRELVRRGAVNLEKRPEPAPVFEASGPEEALRTDFSDGAGRVAGGGAYLWRVPTAYQREVVADVIRAAGRTDGRTLVLAPEISAVERTVSYLRRVLPAGCTVAAYHSHLGTKRSAVYRDVRAGAVDVLVGTRTAALLPLPRLAAICVVDEPNEAHRAEPGYEGLPLHVRDVALERARIEGSAVLFLSVTPSLRIYASKRVRELSERRPDSWPVVRIVDMRGSGAALSATLISACGQAVAEGKRVGVVANRLGYATSVVCNRCGTVLACPRCDLPLRLFGAAALLACQHCGHRDKPTGRCEECGSVRVMPVGPGVERVRADLSDALHEPVGLVTAGERDREDAPVVVGTTHGIVNERWDVVMVADADAQLLGSGMGTVERAFRTLYGAAEAAREHLLVQTRVPEHYALQAAVRGDYRAFAAAELPRLRNMGYPPFSHLASLTFKGPKEVVLRAVESSGLRRALPDGVEMSGVVPQPRVTGSPVWRVLLRGRSRSDVARLGALAARSAATIHGGSRVKVRVDIDPEEV